MRRATLTMGGVAVLTAIIFGLRRRYREAAPARPVLLRESVVIKRPPEEVFSYAADPENMPEWSRMISQVRKDSQGPPKKGDRFTVYMKFFGRRFVSPFEVTAHEPPLCHSERSTGGPFPQEHTRLFEPAAGSGTRVTEVAQGEPGGFFGLVGPLLEGVGKRQIRADLARLKDRLEART